MRAGDARRPKNGDKKRASSKPQRGRPLSKRLMPAGFLGTAFSERDVLSHAWSPEQFMDAMQRWRKDAARKKLLRQAVFWGTRLWAKSRPLTGTTTMTAADSDEPVEPAAASVPFGGLLANDSIEAAHYLCEADRRAHVTVLVMASRSSMGGGVETGAKAQEEDIYRATTLALIPGQVLPLELSSRLDTKVAVCRGAEAFGWPFVKEFACSFISMAGVSGPSVLGAGDDEHMDAKSTLLFERKLQHVLATCRGGTLILGAWGCGVYGCPPAHIARLMRATIAKYGGSTRVYIAIPNHGATSRRNLRAFARAFKCPDEVLRVVPRYQRRALAFLFLLCHARGALGPFFVKQLAHRIAALIVHDDSPVLVALGGEAD